MVKPLVFLGIFLKINQAQLANVLLISMIYVMIFSPLFNLNLYLASMAQNTSQWGCSWKKLGVSEIGVGRRVPYVKPGQVSTHIRYSTRTPTAGATVDLYNGYTRGSC